MASPSSGGIWPSRRRRRSPSTSPVVAMIEPFHREYSSGDENTIKSATTKSDMKESSDMNMTYASGNDPKKDLLFPGPKQGGTRILRGRSVNYQTYTDLPRNSIPSQSLHLENMAAEVSSEQTSPGSVCSTDSGIGSTQSIAELWSQDAAQPPQTNLLDCPKTSNSMTMNIENTTTVTENGSSSSATSTVRLRRFIRRNPRMNSEDPNSSADSLDPVIDSTTHRNRLVHTPEPQPLYRVDVTSQDRIWQKDSKEMLLVSSPLNSLEFPNDSRLWNAGETEPLSDTESESSQDTIILMTSSYEHSHSEDGLPVSEDALQQIRFINDHHVTTNFHDNLQSVKMDSFNGESIIPETDFDQSLVSTSRNDDNCVPIYRHEMYTNLADNANAEQNSMANLRGKSVRFDEAVAMDSTEAGGIISNRQTNKEDSRTSSVTGNKSDQSLKTNFGYLSRTRIPSFRKMNQTFRRPVIKSKQDKPSALEQQLRDLSIAESESEEETSSLSAEATSVPKPLSSQQKKRVHFSEIVLKRIVCPPDNDISASHSNTSVAFGRRHNTDNGSFVRESAYLEKRLDHPITTQINNLELTQDRHNSYSSTVCNTESYNNPNNVTSPLTGTDNNPGRASTEKPVLKYKLFRTPSIDRAHARNFSRQSEITVDLQPDATKTLGHLQDAPTYPAKVENTQRKIGQMNPEKSHIASYEQYHDKKLGLNQGENSKIPFYKDSMILSSAGNREEGNRLIETATTKSSTIRNELEHDELASFVAMDRDRIDKVRRRYKPLLREKQASLQPEMTTERVGLDKTSLAGDTASHRKTVLLEPHESKWRPQSQSDIDSIGVENGFRRNNDSTNPQVVNNGNDHTKTVYGTTADLFRMMDTERLRGSKTTRSNTGSNLVRRHSAHVHGTYEHPSNARARNSRNERNSMFN